MWNFLKRLFGFGEKPKPAKRVEPPVAPAVGRDVTPKLRDYPRSLSAVLHASDAPPHLVNKPRPFREEREPPLHLRNLPKKPPTTPPPVPDSPRLLRTSVKVQPSTAVAQSAPARDDSTTDLLLLGTAMYLMADSGESSRPSSESCYSESDRSDSSQSDYSDSGSSDSSSCD